MPRNIPSHLEESLALQIKAYGLPEPVREYRHIPGRLFRLDFAWPDYRVGVEVQGQIWSKGGHSSGTGIIRDCEKRNLGKLEGWTVLEVVEPQIKAGDAIDWVRRALKQAMEAVK